MAVSKRTRFEVFKRDRFTCQYCGRTPPTVVLHCDHVIPESKGGPDDTNNLATSCEDCNLGKSNVPLGEVPSTVTEQMERTREKREQVEALNQLLLEEREIEDGQITKLGRHYFSQLPGGAKYVFGPSRVQSVRAFLRRLPYAELIEAIDVAAGKVWDSTLNYDDKRFRYFCGFCWSKIRKAEGGDR